MKKLLLLALLSISMGAMAQQQIQVLPVDPDVRTGVLENGLTYYIRHNSTPENRADFYIAQRVGSMQEEDNQAGLAHFLEHMAFNGTTNFPGKTMLNYLQDNGIKFGTNINAYTSFDETVYNISNVPTQNQNLIDSCILVLYDWSCGITLEEDEIDNERGVIREEWRTRGGAQQRLWEKLLPDMFKDSKYAKRMPIGDINIINNFKPEEIRAYYHKWYRPDLQGIIIVGDIDAEKTEKRVKDLFSPIKLEPHRAERIYYPVPDNDEPIVAIASDKESSNTQIMMFYKHEAMPRELKNTQVGYMTDYIMSVAANMMNERFAEIVQKPNAPFIMASAYNSDYFVSKTKEAWTVVSIAAEDKIKDALSAMIRETERVRQHGFTVSEYERARTNMLKSIESTYNNRDKQRNSTYAQEYIRNFIDGEPIPGIEYEYTMMQTLAAQIPLELINQAMQQQITDKNIVIVVTGPEKEGLVYPEKEELKQILKTVRKEKVEAYVEEVSNEPLIATPPTPGNIAAVEKDNSFDATVWTLTNGVQVVLKKTDFKDDEIRMKASSRGGTSHYILQDPINSKVMGEIMNVGGVGNFSKTQLQKALAGKRASATPYIGLTAQGFNGYSSIKDFETMLQLVYLYFTAPRTDDEAFKSYLQRLEVQLKNMEADPMIAFSDTISRVLYGDNPISKRVTFDDLKKIDYARIMDMYRKSFANPGNFIFTFVGNIDEEAVKPLILQYLGSLPTFDVKGDFVKVPLDIKSGKNEVVFEREMQNPKASIFNAFSGSMDRTLKNRLVINMLDQILDIVYTEKVREDEGGTYGVHTSGSISRYPENQTILQIIFDTDPEKADHLNAIVHRELHELVKNGPREADFTKVKEYMLKKHNEDLKENGYWLNHLDTKYFYGQDDHSDYLKIINSITSKDIQDFAQKMLTQENEIIVVMTPQKK